MPQPKSVSALLAAIALAIPTLASAAVSFTTSYTQDFNAFNGDLRTTTPIAWTNDNTVVPTGADGLGTAVFAGWYLYQNSTAAAPTGIQRTNSFNSPTAFYLWRTGAAATDVAFGSMNFDSSSGTVASGGYVAFGFALTNDSGATIDYLNLSYITEKWQSNFATQTTNPDDVVSLSYSVGATGVGNANGTWTSTDLGFTSTPPTASGTANFTTTPATVVGSLNNLNWTPGSTLFIRWVDPNISGTDRGIAVDDIVVTVPEPTAAISALPALALLARRRK